MVFPLNIVGQLAMENRDLSAGVVEEGSREQMVRVIGEFKSIEEIENVFLPLPTGGRIRLAEIAKVEDTLKDDREFVYMNGQPSVQVAIQKQTDANTVKVSSAVEQVLADFKKEMPAGMTLTIGFDQAEYINLALDQVKDNAYLGAGLAILILFLFLHNFWSIMSTTCFLPVPVSFFPVLPHLKQLKDRYRHSVPKLQDLSLCHTDSFSLIPFHIPYSHNNRYPASGAPL